MGSMCSKADGGDNFAQPGRVLGSAPDQPQRAPVPPGAVPSTSTGPPRTLGGGGGGPPGAAGDGDARARAAQAAEARAKAASDKQQSGKLGAQLATQKKQTLSDTLAEASANERRQRDADEAAQARSHN